MSIYGSPSPGQPEDPYQQQPSSSPPGGGYPPPPQGSYPAPPPGGYPPPPDPASGYPPAPGTGYPPPTPEWGQPANPGYTPPTQEWGQPPTSGGPQQPPYGSDQPQSGPPAAPYGSPAAPYGQPGAEYGQQPAAPYGQPGAGYGQPGAPLGPPVAEKKGGGLKIALIIGGIVLVLLCVCGIGGVVWALNQDDDKPTDPIGAPTPSASASARPSSTPSKPSNPGGGSDEDDFRKGDCLVNEGSNDDPELRKVPCGPDTYEVLSRIPFTTDGDRCKDDPIFGSPDTDVNYVYDDSLDIGDFVLCLKER
ncbi:hypothetical protein [Plantactinospora sp. B5E13]|uniref:LppU/SCO3897 family protein n=1 Tax=unclassified Plantactinospora TaxID=2631981 RepID=UPI00325F7C7E